MNQIATSLKLDPATLRAACEQAPKSGAVQVLDPFSTVGMELTPEQIEAIHGGAWFVG